MGQGINHHTGKPMSPGRFMVWYVLKIEYARVIMVIGWCLLVLLVITSNEFSTHFWVPNPYVNCLAFMIMCMTIAFYICMADSALVHNYVCRRSRKVYTSLYNYINSCESSRRHWLWSLMTWYAGWHYQCDHSCVDDNFWSLDFWKMKTMQTDLWYIVTTSIVSNAWTETQQPGVFPAFETQKRSRFAIWLWLTMHFAQPRDRKVKSNWNGFCELFVVYDTDNFHCSILLVYDDLRLSYRKYTMA